MPGDAHAQLAELHRDAFEGKAPKVHESILAAGYSMPDKVVGRGRVAKMFGVNINSIVQWERDGMPVEKAGRAGKGQGAVYDLGAIVQWRCTVLDKLLEESAGKDSPALERWRAARADTAEIQRDQLKGEVGKVDWMMARISTLANVYITQSESLLATLVRRFPDAASEIIRLMEALMAKVKEQIPARPVGVAPVEADEPE